MMEVVAHLTTLENLIAVNVMPDGKVCNVMKLVHLRAVVIIPLAATRHHSSRVHSVYQTVDVHMVCICTVGKMHVVWPIATSAPI